MEEIPPRVRLFVRRHIRSMDHLELLMRLYDARESALHATALQQMAHLDEKTTARCVGDLLGADILREVEPGVYQYGPRAVADRADVDVLAQLYHQRPVSLVKLVYELPVHSIASLTDARPDRGQPGAPER